MQLTVPRQRVSGTAHRYDAVEVWVCVVRAFRRRPNFGDVDTPHMPFNETSRRSWRWSASNPASCPRRCLVSPCRPTHRPGNSVILRRHQPSRQNCREKPTSRIHGCVCSRCPHRWGKPYRTVSRTSQSSMVQGLLSSHDFCVGGPHVPTSHLLPNAHVLPSPRGRHWGPIQTWTTLHNFET